MRAVAGLEVLPAVATTQEVIASADRGARGVHTRHQGPCTPLPLQLRRAATRVALAARRAASAT